MARGIFISGSGLIDLRGNDGAAPTLGWAYAGATGAGGAGGGSFIGLAEKTATGLTNMVIDANRVLTIGGAGAASVGWFVQSHGQAGGPGAFKSQVIG